LETSKKPPRRQERQIYAKQKINRCWRTLCSSRPVGENTLQVLKTTGIKQGAGLESRESKRPPGNDQKNVDKTASV
jgi:hypothetical protein